MKCVYWRTGEKGSLLLPKKEIAATGPVIEAQNRETENWQPAYAQPGNNVR